MGDFLQKACNNTGVRLLELTVWGQNKPKKECKQALTDTDGCLS